MLTSPSPGTRTITSIDVHAEGEVGRVLVGSHLLVRGTTWSERMRWCETELEWLRRLVLREPRGNPAMCGVLVLPPLDPTADVGIIILEQGGFRPMSGANTMCTVTALLETGSLSVTEPETVVRVDTAVGLVEATARVEGGRVRWVRVRNVPSFALALDRKVVGPEYGAVTADVAFGGQFYVMPTPPTWAWRSARSTLPRSPVPPWRSSPRPAWATTRPSCPRSRAGPGSPVTSSTSWHPTTRSPWA
jgi:proline racemase